MACWSVNQCFPFECRALYDGTSSLSRELSFLSRELSCTLYNNFIFIRQLHFLHQYFSVYLLCFMFDFTRNCASGGLKAVDLMEMKNRGPKFLC